MKHLAFNEGWTFSLAGGEPARVTLPHDFMIEDPRGQTGLTGKDIGWFRGGAGVYRRALAGACPQTAFLLLDGCAGLTEIFINGNRAAFHPNIYTPIVADLAQYARGREGAAIEVRVNSLPQPCARWYPGSGLYRGAELLVSDARAYIPAYGLYADTRSIQGGRAEIALEIRAVSDEKRLATLEIEILDADGARVFSLSRPASLEKGENTLRAVAALENARVWSPESPHLYTFRARIIADGVADEEQTAFGARTLRVDGEKGFLLNGEPVKFLGGCLHHDNGPIGAVSLADAETRKLAKLKDAGFNAVRSAHNPASTALLTACDRLGLLVIDEAFDCWRQGKMPFDYHLFFDEWWRRDLTSMLLRDRNHPCVVLWSQGNEIPERGGLSGGHEISREITKLIRGLDSRPITHALCSFWDNPALAALQEATEDQDFDTWGQRTLGIAENLDLCGYNYGPERAEKDRRVFPGRVSVFTETVPRDAARCHAFSQKNPWAAGDFVWTAWDYFGESGIGHIRYGETETRGLMPYPWHISNCGDFDICGQRKPQSHYREIVWGRKTGPYITTSNPLNARAPYAMSLWAFYDGEARWDWAGCEGMESEVRVYARAKRVEAYRNGALIAGADVNEHFVALLRVPYERGTLTARAYGENDAFLGECSLSTPGEACALCVREAYEGDQLTYITLEARDAQNRLAPGYEKRLRARISGAGARLVALATANPESTEPYVTDTRLLYRGTITAVVRTDAKESFALEFQAESLPPITYRRAR